MTVPRRVDSIAASRIYGRIWNSINIVQGFRYRQSYNFPTSEMVDWLISKPDGSEEGNWAGKFLDAFRLTGTPPKDIC